MRFYKVTQKDGINIFTAKGNAVYAVGKVLIEENPEDKSVGVCGRGFHVCKRLKDTWRFVSIFNFKQVAWWEVECDKEDIIVSDDIKTRVRKLRVVREIPLVEALGSKGKSICALIGKLLTASFSFRRDLDKGLVEQLVYEHVLRLSNQGNVDFSNVTVSFSELKGLTTTQFWSMDIQPEYRRVCEFVRYKALKQILDLFSRAVSNIVDEYVTTCVATNHVRDHLFCELANLPENPWAPLVELCLLGCVPVGVINDEFVVYVPQAGDLQ